MQKHRFEYQNGAFLFHVKLELTILLSDYSSSVSKRQASTRVLF